MFYTIYRQLVLVLVYLNKTLGLTLHNYINNNTDARTVHAVKPVFGPQKCRNREMVSLGRPRSMA